MEFFNHLKMGWDRRDYYVKGVIIMKKHKSY